MIKFGKPVSEIVDCKPSEFMRRHADVFEEWNGGMVSLREQPVKVERAHTWVPKIGSAEAWERGQLDAAAKAMRRYGAAKLGEVGGQFKLKRAAFEADDRFVLTHAVRNGQWMVSLSGDRDTHGESKKRAEGWKCPSCGMKNFTWKCYSCQEQQASVEEGRTTMEENGSASKYSKWQPSGNWTPVVKDTEENAEIAAIKEGRQVEEEVTKVDAEKTEATGGAAEAQEHWGGCARETSEARKSLGRCTEESWMTKQTAGDEADKKEEESDEALRGVGQSVEEADEREEASGEEAGGGASREIGQLAGEEADEIEEASGYALPEAEQSAGEEADKREEANGNASREVEQSTVEKADKGEEASGDASVDDAAMTGGWKDRLSYYRKTGLCKVSRESAASTEPQRLVEADAFIAEFATAMWGVKTEPSCEDQRERAMEVIAKASQFGDLIDMDRIDQARAMIQSSVEERDAKGTNDAMPDSDIEKTPSSKVEKNEDFHDDTDVKNDDALVEGMGPTTIDDGTTDEEVKDLEPTRDTEEWKHSHDAKSEQIDTKSREDEGTMTCQEEWKQKREARQ